MKTEIVNRIEDTIHSEIPLSVVMGIEVRSFTEKELILSAPLSENINHKNTAFGGSLYNVSVLSGWATLYGMLIKEGVKAHIVIQNSEIDYITPVKSEIVGCCKIPSKCTIATMIKTFKKHGRSRIALSVEIKEKDKIAVKFTGKYVIHT